MSKAIQLRGHCQVCGRQHAVVSGGFVAKHGYTVKDGWFQGVCPGQNYAPIEVNREQLDRIVAYLRDLAGDEMARAELVRTGKSVPGSARTGRSAYAIVKGERIHVPETVTWAEASEGLRGREIERVIWECEQKASRAKADANALAALGDRVHGQRLEVAHKPAAPEPILVGEKRVAQRGVLEAFVVDRGRVRWRDARGFGSEMSARSWRSLPKAQS